MVRKVLLYIAFVSLLIVAALLQFTNRKSTLRKGQMNFVLEEPSLVNKIVIKNRADQLCIGIRP